MRKIMAFLLPALLFAAAFPLSSCARPKARPRISYAIEAEYFPETRTAAGECRVTFRNDGGDALSVLPFLLPANILREGNSAVPAPYAPAAYYKGKNYGGITVLSAEGAESFSVNAEGSVLSAALKEELFPGETAEIVFRFETCLPEINYRFGVGERAVNLAGFYPVLCPFRDGEFLLCSFAENGDPYAAECADCTLALTLPLSYGAAFGGRAEESVSEGKRTFRVTLPSARDIAAVLGEGMLKKEAKAGDVTVEYCYFDDPSPEKTLAAATESLAWFGETFGSYGREKYCVAETDLPYGGAEFTALSMISRSLRAEDRAEVVVHETAHQWWYAKVGSDQFNEAWQDEGLAEFSAACFFGAHPAYGIGYRSTVEACENACRAYFTVSGGLGAEDRRMSRPLTEFSGPYEYRSLVYDEGVVLFDRVLLVAGEKKFYRALRNYCNGYGGRIASPAELSACFRRAGANVEGLFESFLTGKCVV